VAQTLCPASRQPRALAPLSGIAAPSDLKQLAFADLHELATHRAWLDRLIIDWAQSLREPDLDLRLHYHNMRGVAADKPFFGLLVHFSIIRPTTGAN